MTFVFHFLISSSSGESRLRSEPDRRGGGDVGHHHVGGSPLQPDRVSSLGTDQERHWEPITAPGMGLVESRENESLKDRKRG